MENQQTQATLDNYLNNHPLKASLLLEYRVVAISTHIEVDIATRYTPEQSKLYFTLELSDTEMVDLLAQVLDGPVDTLSDRLEALQMYLNIMPGVNFDYFVDFDSDNASLSIRGDEASLEVMINPDGLEVELYINDNDTNYTYLYLEPGIDVANIEAMSTVLRKAFVEALSLEVSDLQHNLDMVAENRLDIDPYGLYQHKHALILHAMRIVLYVENVVAQSH